MNDRFRFRAIDNRDWVDEDEKGKIYYDVQDAYDYGGGEPEVPASSFGCIVDGEGWIVEQCTGLKDKNGRLIYENDYVKIGDEIFRVFWNITKISLENMLKNDIIDMQNNYIMEIIGNAHEERDIREVQKNS